MEREIKKIVTPISKQEVSIKTWLTGGEKRIITNSLMKDVKFNPNDSKSMEFSGDILTKSQDVAIETIIVDIAGDSKDILKNILNMRSEDYDFIIDAINKITNGEKEEEIKKE